VNIADTIDGARRAFEIAGRGCLVRMGGDELRYATVRVISYQSDFQCPSNRRPTFAGPSHAGSIASDPVTQRTA
jgi:hypothetical protein